MSFSLIIIDDSSSDEGELGTDVHTNSGRCGGIIDCPDGRVFYPTPQPRLDCLPLIEGFDAGYCCAQRSPDVPELGEITACGEQAYQSDVFLPGEPCFNSSESYCCNKCPIHLRWDPHERAECIANKNGSGFCCPYPAMTNTFDDDSRKALKPLPMLKPKSQPYELNTHLKQGSFKDKKWKVVECSDKGDCFYDCVARAINSAEAAEPPAMTVSLLRWNTARVIDDGTVHAFRQDYMMNAPDDETLIMYSNMDAKAMQMYVMTPDHYATRIDIEMIYENKELDIIPIVINSKYGSRLKSVPKAETQGTTISYLANRSRYDSQQRQYRRFILLYKMDEHFRLVVRNDLTLPNAHKERFGIQPSIRAYRAVFNADEIPEAILKEFEKHLS